MAKKKTSSFSRAGIGFNVIVQAACVVFLLIAANYAGFNYYKRWDLSRSQKFSLAEQTKQVLREIKQPLKIILYSSPTNLGIDAMIYPDTQNLLKELEFSGRQKIQVEYVDPTRDPGRGREVQDDFDFDGAQNSLLLTYGGRRKVIPLMDLGDFDLSGIAVGENARLNAFKGEQVLTSAFMELLDAHKSKIYLLQGHGETTADRLQTFLDFIHRQNVDTMWLPLLTTLSVPPDADAVCLIAPRLDLTEPEVAALKDYWTRGGRLLILLDPDASTPNLSQFLSYVFIIPRDDRVIRIASDVTDPGVIKIYGQVIGGFLPDAPITKRLGNVSAFLPKPTQSLALEPAAAARADIQLRPLIQSIPGYWGETKYRNAARDGVKFDEGVDTQPAVVAASAEKGGTENDETDVATSRMVVIGCALFADDDVVKQAPGNLDFLMSSLNRLLDKSKRSGVAPKTITNFALNLTGAQVQKIALYTLILIPGAVALLGLIVGFRRRA